MWRITYLALLILSSCGGPPDISNANGTESARAQPSYKPVTGYGNVELGTSFESAIGSLDAKLFDRLLSEEPEAAKDLGPSLDSEFVWFNQTPASPLPALW